MEANEVLLAGHSRPLLENRAEGCRLVNPFRCRMWSLHDRMEDEVTAASCRVEIESFVKHGQLIPALGRPLNGDPEHDVELIYGARRLFVARHINQPLLVKLESLTDREALVAMDIENRHRVDISPYERGRSYAKWLRAGHFKSQEEIAKALHISSSNVCRFLKIARLPTVIVGAFGSPVEILEQWGLHLAEAWEDPVRRASLARVAREIAAATERAPAKAVYERLVAAEHATGRSKRASVRDKAVLSAQGRLLFRVKRQRNAFVVWLPTATTSRAALEEIERIATEILQRQDVQHAVDCGHRVAQSSSGRNRETKHVAGVGL